MFRQWLRRSRFSRASAGPRERAKNSTARSIHRSAGARIVKDAAHHLLGIAPLFRASGETLRCGIDRPFVGRNAAELIFIAADSLLSGRSGAD